MHSRKEGLRTGTQTKLNVRGRPFAITPLQNGYAGSLSKGASIMRGYQSRCCRRSKPALSKERHRALDLLVEGTLLHAHKYNGLPIGLQLPMFVELEVSEAEPAVRGDTSSGSGTKIAKLETGLTIRVPLFIKQGEKVRIATETREFSGRA